VGGVAVDENAVHVEDYGLGVGHGENIDAMRGWNHRGAETRRKAKKERDHELTRMGTNKSMQSTFVSHAPSPMLWGWNFCWFNPSGLVEVFLA
jgi:hypothetical protein